MVYTTAHRSLALLEGLVHMRNAQQISVPLHSYVMLPVTFDEELLEELSFARLPSDWDAEPPNYSSKSIGDAWLVSGSSPILSVPSVMVPEERNFLLNPNHKLFSRIRIGSPVPCKFDPRLL